MMKDNQKMSFAGSPRKKIRGQKRRLNALLRQIDDLQIPAGRDDVMKHLHVPSSQWIEMPKTSGKVKTEFCRKWISKTEEFVRQMADQEGFHRVVAVISYPELWNSEIIFFYDEEYYQSFWDRKGPYQTWTRLENRSFAAERGIKTKLTESGYLEELMDEDFTYRGFLWFYE